MSRIKIMFGILKQIWYYIDCQKCISISNPLTPPQKKTKNIFPLETKPFSLGSHETFPESPRRIWSESLHLSPSEISHVLNNNVGDINRYNVYIYIRKWYVYRYMYILYIYIIYVVNCDLIYIARSWSMFMWNHVNDCFFLKPTPQGGRFSEFHTRINTLIYR